MERKLLALLLALMMALSGIAAAEEEPPPTQWDLTELYEDAEAWQADYARAMELLPQQEAYLGTLNTAQGIYDYIHFVYMEELTQLQNRLTAYADLGNMLDPSDSVFNELRAKLDVMASEEARYEARAEAEILALPLETRQEIFADPLLEPFAYQFRRYADPDYEPLSAETKEALAVLGFKDSDTSDGENVFNILYNVDLPDPMITMPDGTEAELTEQLYNQIIYGNEYDRDFKAQCDQVDLTRVMPYVNTFAALLNMTVSDNWGYAQVQGYESSREAAMDAMDVDPAIYDMIIQAAHQGVEDYQRYLDAHKRGLGLEAQYGFDMASSVSDYTAGEISYEEAVE